MHSSLNPFKGQTALITVGPTREYLDSVRFISNASSGKLGLAIAHAFRFYGAQVFLVCGPGVSSEGFPSVSVVSAREMLRESRKKFFQSDFFVSCAAVSDYRPQKRSAKKIHKNKPTLNVPLVRNPDILASLAREKTKQFFVGFALEDSNGIKNAIKKMNEKKCDLIVLNAADTMESDFINASFIFPTGSVQKLGKMNKDKFAEKLCRVVASMVSAMPNL